MPWWYKKVKLNVASVLEGLTILDPGSTFKSNSKRKWVKARVCTYSIIARNSHCGCVVSTFDLSSSLNWATPARRSSRLCLIRSTSFTQLDFLRAAARKQRKNHAKTLKNGWNPGTWKYRRVVLNSQLTILTCMLLLHTLPTSYS